MPPLERANLQEAELAGCFGLTFFKTGRGEEEKRLSLHFSGDGHHFYFLAAVWYQPQPMTSLLHLNQFHTFSHSDKKRQAASMNPTISMSSVCVFHSSSSMFLFTENHICHALWECVGLQDMFWSAETILACVWIELLVTSGLWRCFHLWCNFLLSYSVCLTVCSV